MRKPGRENRPGLFGRFDFERAAVPHDYVARYEKAQPQAGGATIVRAGHCGGHLYEGIEDHLQRVDRNRGAVVRHPHADHVVPAVRLEYNRRVFGAVLNRIVQKVREHLLQAGAVESAANLARYLEAKGALGMSRLHLLERGFADACDAASLPHDRNPASEPRTGVFQKISDHRVHLGSAALNAAHGLQLPLAFEHPHLGKVGSRCRDRAQRAAQIVPQDREEGVPRARDLVCVTCDRLRQRPVDQRVEVREVVQRAMVLLRQMRPPQLDDARPQRPVFRTDLQQVEAAQMPQRTVRRRGGLPT